MSGPDANLRITVSGDPTPEQVDVIRRAVERLLDQEAAERDAATRLSNWQLALQESEEDETGRR